MNRSFENIFEKYNITCKIPRKRHKSIPTLTQTALNKKEENLKRNFILQNNVSRKVPSNFSNSMKIQSINSSCFLNTSTKGKYYIPTRYKTLEVFKVKSIPKRLSCPVTENNHVGICKRANISKENCAEQISPWCGYKFGDKKVERDLCISIIESGDKSGKVSEGFNESLSNCLSISKSKQSYKQEHNLSISTSFENPNLTCTTSSFSDYLIHKPFPSLSISLKTTETEDNSSITKSLVQNSNTELDLFIDLILYEEKKNKQQQEKSLNCNASLSAKKSSVKGEFQEIFERALKRETVNGNFLKYDRKMGLRAGKLLTAVEIVTSYGLTMAIVKSDDLNKNFAIILSPQMASILMSGSQIEAFFDDKTLPYKFTFNGECLDIYLEPYKILIQ